MADSQYPEIHALQEIHQNFNIQISLLPGQFLANKDYYPAVEVIISKTSFLLFVDDEYSDFQLNNPVLSLCLVLRELETYKEAADFLSWCTEKGLDASVAEIRTYYMGLNDSFMAIEKMLGKIDSHISDYDFGLNGGAARALRSHRE